MKSLMLDQLLNEAADAITRGGDTSPSLRFKIEAEIENILSGDPSAFDDVLQCVRSKIAGAQLDMSSGTLRFDIWQQRAPVVPST